MAHHCQSHQQKPTYTCKSTTHKNADTDAHKRSTTQTPSGSDAAEASQWLAIIHILPTPRKVSEHDFPEPSQKVCRTIANNCAHSPPPLRNHLLEPTALGAIEPSAAPPILLPSQSFCLWPLSWVLHHDILSLDHFNVLLLCSQRRTCFATTTRKIPQGVPTSQDRLPPALISALHDMPMAHYANDSTHEQKSTEPITSCNSLPTKTP